ncbi:MAG TPA: GNAT family N-acetyltransferase, partial [Candidatus Dormibacteraeota bacterium]
MEPPKGFRVRPPGMDDLEDVLAVMNAHEAIYGPEARTLAEDVHESWTRPSFDLDSDARVVLNEQNRIVAYVDVRELDKPRVEADGYVHPDFEGRGIGTLLLSLAEERARSVEAGIETGQRRDLESGIFANNPAAVKLFEEQGFRCVRYFIFEEIHLESAPPQPAWPAGVTVRSFREGEALAPVYETVQETFKDHWGQRQRDLEEWTHIWQAGGMDPSLWFIAESGGTIAGVSLCKMRDDAGYVPTLGVLRPFRGLGLGLALLLHSFSEFYRRGVPIVRLDVDSESLTGANRLYERAG